MDSQFVSMLTEDLEQLGKETIPVETPEYKEVFGEESKTFLEWVSKRINYFGLGALRKKSLAEYTKHRVLFIRRPKSVYFNEEAFYEGSVSRRDTLVHEAYHFEKPFHYRCKQPSHLKGKNGCDSSLASAFGAGYLYSVLPENIEEVATKYSSFITLTYLATGLDRILSFPDRRRMAKLFQKHLLKLSSYTRATLSLMGDYVLKDIREDEKVKDYYKLHASDISELFQE